MQTSISIHGNELKYGANVACLCDGKLHAETTSQLRSLLSQSQNALEKERASPLMLGLTFTPRSP
jgi:hypothetical protein